MVFSERGTKNLRILSSDQVGSFDEARLPVTSLKAWRNFRAKPYSVDVCSIRGNPASKLQRTSNVNTTEDFLRVISFELEVQARKLRDLKRISDSISLVI